MRKKRILKIIALALCGAMIVGMGALLGGNAYVKGQSKERIYTPEQAAELTGVDCILVLGCGIWNNRPSHMLQDRLECGIRLYEQGSAPKLLMSGDHGRKEYDEVNVMKDYAKKAGVPSQDIFMDHAGFSTYESLYRAKEVFGAKKIVIVSQEYHLYRAIYTARALGLEAYGVEADRRIYRGQAGRELREVLARCKDLVYSVLKPEPTFLGEPISLKESGDMTNG